MVCPELRGLAHTKAQYTASIIIVVIVTTIMATISSSIVTIICLIFITISITNITITTTITINTTINTPPPSASSSSISPSSQSQLPSPPTPPPSSPLAPLLQLPVPGWASPWRFLLTGPIMTCLAVSGSQAPGGYTCLPIGQSSELNSKADVPFGSERSPHLHLASWLGYSLREMPQGQQQTPSQHTPDLPSPHRKGLERLGREITIRFFRAPSNRSPR